MRFGAIPKRELAVWEEDARVRIVMCWPCRSGELAIRDGRHRVGIVIRAITSRAGDVSSSLCH